MPVPIYEKDWESIQTNATAWLRRNNRNFSGALIDFATPTSRVADITLTQGVGTSLTAGPTCRLWLRPPRIARAAYIGTRWAQATVTELKTGQLVELFPVCYGAVSEFVGHRLTSAMYHTIQDYGMAKGVHDTESLHQVITLMNTLCGTPFSSKRMASLDKRAPFWRWVAILCPTIDSFCSLPDYLPGGSETASPTDRESLIESLASELAVYQSEEAADAELTSVMKVQRAMIDQLASTVKNSPLVGEVNRRQSAPVARRRAASPSEGRFPPRTEFLEAAKRLLGDPSINAAKVLDQDQTPGAGEVCAAMSWLICTLSFLFPQLTWNSQPNVTNDRYWIVGRNAKNNAEVRIEVFAQGMDVRAGNTTAITQWLASMPSHFTAAENDARAGDLRSYIDVVD